MSARRFPAEELEALREAKIVGVRAGSEHRYTGYVPALTAPCLALAHLAFPRRR